MCVTSRSFFLKYCFWLTFFIFLIAVPAHGLSTNTTWAYRAWQSDEGLPDNTVVGVEQSDDGFLWVTTRSGLARFDGVLFGEFNSANSAGAQTALMYASHLDRSNRLWVAKDRGVIVCVDRGRTTALTPENGLPIHEVRTIVHDREGDLWVSYIGAGGVGGEVLRISGQKIRRFTTSDGLPGGFSTCQLASDKDGQIWFAQGNRVGVFRGGGFTNLMAMQAQRIAMARSGGIWIYGSDSKQLYKFVEGGSRRAYGRLPTDRFNVNATVLYEDRSGALWIGTQDSGLFRHDGAAFKRITTAHYDIRTISEDRDGNIWVGTEGGGLNRIQPRSLELVDVNSGIDKEAVRSVCQDIDGDLWAVTQSGVLVRNTGDGWRNAATNNGVHIAFAQCVCADPLGGVWVGTQYLGLFSSRSGFTYSLAKANGLASISVRSLLATSTGDLWIGTESSNALHRLRGGKLQNYELPEGSSYISAMAIDASRKFWAGTADGQLIACDGDVLVNETAKALSPPKPIRSLFATPDGSVWIGYGGGGGLGRLKDGGFSHFGVNQGLHDSHISHIVADNQGRLWFGGNRGIFYVKQTEFDALAASRQERVRSIVYGSDEGLPNLQASYGVYPGAVLAKNSDLMIPMLNGLASVKIGKLKQNLKQSPVVITRVVVDDSVIAAYEYGESAERIEDLAQPKTELKLPPDHQRIEIEFTALSFTAPRNVSFKYKLEPLETAWVDLKEGQKRQASYTRVAPGDYTFRLKASNDWGLWSNPEIRLSIKIKPHFWQTWTFRVFASFLLCGIVGLAVRARHRRRILQLEQQRTMDGERARIAQDLHDDLGSGLTEISFGSEFAQDTSLGIVEMRQHAQAIGDRARELVASLDEIVWALNPKNDTVASLASYQTQYAERFLKPTRVRLRLNVARDLPALPLNADERHNLFLAFKEALNNVVQHSKATDVQLTIGEVGNVLKIIIVDNGRGFDPEIVISEADGLGNMRRRMERIGGSYSTESLKGKGATVTLTFPLSRK